MPRRIFLCGPLRGGTLTIDDLRQVQRRRELPTRLTQAMQIPLQKMLFKGVIEKAGDVRVPLFVKVLRAFPFLRRIPARVIGMGFRPEHIRHAGNSRAMKKSPEALASGLCELL